METFLPLSKIETAGLQVRAETTRAHVDDLAELIEANDGAWPEALPPLAVFHDGNAYRLADGHHRYQAAQAGGCVEVSCVVHEGDRTAALWHAIGANSDHGLRRTSEDKRRAVLLAYQLDPRLSDREIARRARVSNGMASYVLREVRRGGPLCNLHSGDRPSAAAPPLCKSDSGSAAAGDWHAPGETKDSTRTPFDAEAPVSPAIAAGPSRLAPLATPTATASTSATSAPADPAPDIRIDARGRQMDVSNIGRPKPPSTSSTSSTSSTATEAGRPAAPRGVDEAGRPIPSDTTARAFASLDHFADIEADLMRVAKKIDALGDLAGAELYRAEHLHSRQKASGSASSVRWYSPDLANVVRELRHWRPYAGCPKCPEAPRNTCDLCKGLGYVTESTWGRLPEAMTAKSAPVAAAA